MGVPAPIDRFVLSTAMRAGVTRSRCCLLLPRRSLAASSRRPHTPPIELVAERHGGCRAERAARCAADTLEGASGSGRAFEPSPTGRSSGGARTGCSALAGGLAGRRRSSSSASRTRTSASDARVGGVGAAGPRAARKPVCGTRGRRWAARSGPYRQSERMGSGLYQELADRLTKEDAYPCFCTAEELDLKRKAAEAAGENPQYDGTWRDADPVEVQKRLDAGEPYTVRFKVPRGKKITISDLVRGEVTWDVQATVGDFILLRSAEGTAEAAGMPVYNFCVAVDDALMDVTTVIRAEERLTNTVRQILILEALGYDVPKYAHLSLVLGEDRSKDSRSATARRRSTSSARRASCPRRWSTTSASSAGTTTPSRTSTRWASSPTPSRSTASPSRPPST